MNNQNLDQIRAASALAYCNSGMETRGKEGGQVLKKLPALIMGNGLLAAGAFACSQRQGGWRNCFDHIAKHLANPVVGIVQKCSDLNDLMSFLVGPESSSHTLQMATSETLAWLAFARRFEPHREDADNDSDE